MTNATASILKEHLACQVVACCKHGTPTIQSNIAAPCKEEIKGLSDCRTALHIIPANERAHVQVAEQALNTLLTLLQVKHAQLNSVPSSRYSSTESVNPALRFFQGIFGLHNAITLFPPPLYGALHELLNPPNWCEEEALSNNPIKGCSPCSD